MPDTLTAYTPLGSRVGGELKSHGVAASVLLTEIAHAAMIDLRLNPDDAAGRGLHDGDLVRIFNDRGACLAGLAVDEAVRPGVAQLSTGAWYDQDPANPGFCRHGNPNVLTADRPSSTLSQGCTGQLARVEIEPYRCTPPELSVTGPPPATA